MRHSSLPEQQITAKVDPPQNLNIGAQPFSGHQNLWRISQYTKVFSSDLEIINGKTSLINPQTRPDQNLETEHI